MSPAAWRYRNRCWSCFGAALVIALVGTVVIVTELLAQGRLPMEIVPVFNWLSFAGVAALAGVAVQWGATRERMKDIHTLKYDVNSRFDRIERQIDSLFEVVGAERRRLDRLRYGERVDPTPPPEDA